MRTSLKMWVVAASVAASVQPTLAATNKYQITPEEHAACDGDAEKLCFSAYPDEDKMLSCMKAKRNELTPICLVTLKTGLTRRHIPL